MKKVVKPVKPKATVTAKPKTTGKTYTPKKAPVNVSGPTKRAAAGATKKSIAPKKARVHVSGPTKRAAADAARKSQAAKERA